VRAYRRQRPDADGVLIARQPAQEGRHVLLLKLAGHLSSGVVRATDVLGGKRGRYLGRGSELALVRGRRAVGQQEVHNLSVALPRCYRPYRAISIWVRPDSERALLRGSDGERWAEERSCVP
jgi:hypothetical protein